MARRQLSELPQPGRPVDRAWFESRLRAAGLTQVQIADALKVHGSIITNWLRGRTIATLRVGDAVSFAKLLRVDPAELMQRAGFDLSGPGSEIVAAVLPDGRVSPVTARRGERAQVAGASPDLQAAIFDTENATSGLAVYHSVTVLFNTQPGTRLVSPGLSILEATPGHALPILGVPENVNGGVSIHVFGTSRVLMAERIVRTSPVVALVWP